MLDNIKPTAELRTLARSNARDYLSKSVHHKLLADEIANGWEVIKKRKISVSLKKPKNHGVLLEDRVWTLIYRMQFGFLSAQGGGKLWLDLKDKNGPKSQIDVIGIDDEIALAVECKSQEKYSKRPQFQQELAKLAQLRERFAKAANNQTLFPGPHKRQTVLLFFLANVDLSKNDRERAAEANVLLFDERDLDYYEKLIAYLGPAAKYQFFADMLPGKTVPGLELRVPSVRTKMGQYYSYSFPISPEYLLKISYVSHRSKGKASDVHTYQRMLSKNRLNKIRQYISESGIFPTNIVVNLDKKRLTFERIKQETAKHEQEESGIMGWLTIRPTYKSAWIIDGQHRLFAYSGHPRAKASHLSVLAFEGLPPSKQAQLFIDINAKQKSVKQSLLQELFAELHWEAEKPSVRVQAVISKAIQVLDADKDSPLHGRIQTADATKDSTRCISLTSIFNAVEKTGFHIVKEKKESVIEYGPLWAATTEDTLERTVYVLKEWLNEIRKHCEQWWELGSGEGGGLAMNDGITACINILRSVFIHLDQKGVKLIHLDNDDLLEIVRPYACALGKYFGTLTPEQRKGFRDLRGVQGQTARTRRCQFAIREEISDFNPVGLDEFMALEKEKTNLRGKEIIDRIERTLQTVIIEELKQEYGSSENEWWLLGVPKKVRMEAGTRFENDDGKRGSKEAYFELMDYRRITLEKWDIFGKILGYGTSGNKEKKTSWMVMVNEKRNIVSHPSSGVSLTLEELAQIEELEKWILRQIENSSTGGDALGANGNETEESDDVVEE
ncbi:MAG TPA: DGQHR domain-containing protein [Candidatus Desulfobacillus sp.]|nr:DGQHR domain-containing protein [Candidatus Desulfobacillus sp.]